MKIVLLLTVLLSGIVTASAAAIEPAEAPVEVQEEKPVAENEVEVKAPKEEAPEELSIVEPDSSDQGQVCAPGLVREENSCYLYMSTTKPLSSAEEGAFIESVKKNLPADVTVEPVYGRRRRRKVCLCLHL